MIASIAIITSRVVRDTAQEARRAVEAVQAAASPAEAAQVAASPAEAAQVKAHHLIHPAVLHHLQVKTLIGWTGLKSR